MRRNTKDKFITYFLGGMIFLGGLCYPIKSHANKNNKEQEIRYANAYEGFKYNFKTEFFKSLKRKREDTNPCDEAKHALDKEKLVEHKKNLVEDTILDALEESIVRTEIGREIDNIREDIKKYFEYKYSCNFDEEKKEKNHKKIKSLKKIESKDNKNLEMKLETSFDSKNPLSSGIELNIKLFGLEIDNSFEPIEEEAKTRISIPYINKLCKTDINFQGSYSEEERDMKIEFSYMF